MDTASFRHLLLRLPPVLLAGWLLLTLLFPAPGAASTYPATPTATTYAASQRTTDALFGYRYAYSAFYNTNLNGNCVNAFQPTKEAVGSCIRAHLETTAFQAQYGTILYDEYFKYDNIPPVYDYRIYTSQTSFASGQGLISTGYYCPAGQSLSGGGYPTGGQCTGLACDAGDSLSGATCTHTTYACDAGDALTGQTCAHDDPPPAVTGLTASQGTAYGVVNLTWTASPTANGYDVYRAATASGTPVKLNGDPVTTASHADSGVSGTTHYFYTVVARLNNAASSPSSQAEGWARMPAAVSDLAATQGTVFNAVQLSWGAVQGATGYDVYRAASATASPSKLTGSPITTTGYTDDAASDGTHYVYTVVVRVGAAGSSPSNQSEGWAKPLPAIADLAASQGTVANAVQLNWSAAPNATGYDVYRAPASTGVFVKLNGSTITANAHTDTSASGATHYLYKVVARAGTVASPPSNQAEGWAKPLESVADLTATQGTVTNAVALAWTASANATGYEVYRSTVSSGGGTKLGTATSTGYSDPVGAVVTKYYYTVRAVADGAASSASAAAMGYANVAPASASVALSSGPTAPGDPVAATINDPNAAAGQTESFTLAIATPPAHGSVAVDGLRFTYTPPTDGGFGGSDGFTFTVTDRGGAQATGTGTISVACPAPAIAGLTLPAALSAQGSASAAYAYTALPCNGVLSASLVLAQKTTTVKTIPLPTPAPGTGQTGTVSIDGLDAGTYKATLTLTGDFGTATKTGNLTVAAIPAPVLTVTPQTLFAGETQATAAVADPAGNPCPLTGDDAVARADHGKCLVTLASPPAGLVVGADPTSGLPKATGTLSAGDFQVAAAVVRYGTDGLAHAVATASAAFTVSPVTTAAFALAGKTDVYAAVDTVSLTLAQTAGTTCRLFLDAPAARAEAATGRRACLATLTLPTGLAAKAGTANTVTVSGKPTTPGATSVDYRIDRMASDGATTPLASNSVPLTVRALPALDLALGGGSPLGTDRYAAIPGKPLLRVTASNGATAIAKSQTMVLTVSDAAGTLATINNVTGGATYPVGLPAPLALYQEKALTLRLAYANAPAVFVERTVTAVGAVPADTKLALAAPAQAVDTDPVSATVSLGRPARTGLAYDPAAMGQWRAWISAIDGTGQAVQLTDKTILDGDGQATFSLVPAGSTSLKLVASAELLSPVAGLEQRLDSASATVLVARGSPIQGAVSASRVDGPVPLASTLSLALTRDNAVALKSVSWEESADGGLTWTPVAGQSAARLAVRLALPGRRSYRAVMVNRNTLAESASNAVEVWAYDRLALAVAGPAFTAPDVPASLVASATLGGQPAGDAVIEWATEQPSGAQSGTGAAFTVQDGRAGSILAKLRARPAGTRADDPDAWTQARFRVTVAAPVAPSVAIRGPREVETGRAHHYDGTAKPLWGQAASALALASEWELPDGSTVSGGSLDWTPDVDTPPTGKLRFRAWVDGHRADTTATAELAYSAWTYAWPNWTLAGTLDTPRAPATAALRVRQDRPDMARRFEGLKYDWSFPAHVTPGFNVLDRTRDSVSASLDLAGDHALGVTVSDARGNSTTLTGDFTVQAPTPYALALAVSPSNKWSRAPMDVGVRPQVSGGHPKDRIVGYAFALDGVDQGLPPAKAYGIVHIDRPGPHDIAVTAASAMGKTVSQSLHLDLAANVPPVCTTKTTSAGNMVTVWAQCADADGRIAGYQWAVDGTALATGSDHVSFNGGSTRRQAWVTLTARDDAGESSIPVSSWVNY